MEEFYNKHYKKLMLIPIIMFLIAFLIIFNNYRTTGDIINKDVTLMGGLSIEIYSDKNLDEKSVEKELVNKYPNGDFFVKKLADLSTSRQSGIIIESTNVKEKEIKKTLTDFLKIELTDSKNYFVRETSSSLGQSFYRQMIFTLLLAFLFMMITVFIVYRKVIPTLAIISSPIIDIAVTIAAIDLLNLRISTAGISALLLMIGYGIDTDILLTTKTLKRKDGRVFQRIKASFKTGITMTLTTIFALIFAFFITKSTVIHEMFFILIIGLSQDIISTYVWNAGILRWYLKNED